MFTLLVDSSQSMAIRSTAFALPRATARAAACRR